MGGTGLHIATADLPATLPIFPLAGVLLLPRGRLPLNIFEPRYLAMTRDALGGDRLIGMVQPIEEECGGRAPAIYRTGCAGRITQFSETDDGRFLVTLTGVARFAISEEIATLRGYRRVLADWQPFQGDLEDRGEAPIDRPRLTAALEGFFKLHAITADWGAIAATPDERLVTSLAMICPFAPNEKQALLEAPDLAERARLLTALVEMAMLQRAPDGGGRARH